jgi:hypothetical protein
MFSSLGFHIVVSPIAVQTNLSWALRASWNTERQKPPLLQRIVSQGIGFEFEYLGEFKSICWKWPWGMNQGLGDVFS